LPCTWDPLTAVDYKTAPWARQLCAYLGSELKSLWADGHTAAFPARANGEKEKRDGGRHWSISARNTGSLGIAIDE